MIVSLLLVATTVAGAKGPKYIFYFIGDGMGINSVYTGELVNAAKEGVREPQALAFSSFPYRGFISTYSASALVTDSAAAGTALATGTKTYNGAIGKDADKNDVYSVAIAAKKAGAGAAVMSTVAINHATPAAFYAHAESRNQYDVIGLQLPESGIDFAAASGFLTNKKNPDVTREILIENAREKGMNVLIGAESLKDAAASPKTLFLASGEQGEMPCAIEGRDCGLADMVKAGIANMTKYHKKGFFLMAEGGMIDYANHSNDLAGMVGELNDMDEAIKVALEFYKAHPNETLILVTADHETGGVTMGNGKYELRPDAVLCQKVSKGALTHKLAALREFENPTWDDAKQIISENTGLWKEIPVNYSEEAELMKIFDRTIRGRENKSDKSLYAENEILCTKALNLLYSKDMIVYSHGSHTGAQVPVFAIGNGAKEIAACRDNTELPKTIMKLAGYTK